MEKTIDKKTKIQENVFTFLSITMVVLYPILFIYFNNVDKGKFGDLWGLIGLYYLNAGIVFLLAYLYLRSLPKAGLVTNIIMILIESFGLVERLVSGILPMLYYWHFVMLLITLAFLVAYFTKSKFQSTLSHHLNVIFFIMFTVLIIFNGVRAAPTIMKSHQEGLNLFTTTIQKGTGSSKSNVYLFIFDEYGGYDNLLRYCDFDNSMFYEDLETLGFNVSKDSRNYTRFTSIEIPNLLSLEVVAQEDWTHDARLELLENPRIFQLFKANDYKINLLVDDGNNPGYLPINAENTDYSYFTKSSVYGTDTIQSLIVQNSIYYPFILYNDLDELRIEEINDIFQYLQDSSKLEDSNLFTFGYLMLPHHPLVVDENGNIIDEVERFNWLNVEGYIGQLKYTSNKILTLVQNIIENDPDSIIFLQSDHGFRYAAHESKITGEPIANSEQESFYMRNILNVVYYKGEEIDIDSLSGVNTLILILNQHFGLNYELQPNPE